MFDVYKPGGNVGWATWPLLLAGIAATVGLAFLYQLFLELGSLYLYQCFDDLWAGNCVGDAGWR